ncbi:hypothetical protein AXG89_29110 (plasmid) [Burkholderia sp. PAMC 26561]|nr:hypothetical protein AXG89_23575 [Burkholderia sp. PAMC 26561]AME27898.1 hypothetical protein AXG89_29110 [Burkholderia sp. PAMC 26561]
MKVVEFGTFNRAAGQLRITQPALSRRISSLEDEVKTKLFDRHGHGVTLTDAGIVLRDHAEGLLRHLEQVQCELTSRASTPSGSLSVGLPAPFRSIVSSTLIPAFCLEHPQVKLHIFENTPLLIFNLLQAGSLELGVISGEEPPSGLTCDPFLTESLFLVGATKHGLQLDCPVSAARLPTLPLVQAPFPSAVRTLLARYFSGGEALSYNVEVDSYHLMIDIAASGHSFTILPFSAIREHVQSGQICAAPIAELQMHWVVARPVERQISVAARRFENSLRRLTYEEVQSGRWLSASYHDAQ